MTEAILTKRMHDGRDLRVTIEATPDDGYVLCADVDGGVTGAEEPVCGWTADVMAAVLAERNGGVPSDYARRIGWVGLTLDEGAACDAALARAGQPPRTLAEIEAEIAGLAADLPEDPRADADGLPFDETTQALHEALAERRHRLAASERP